MPLTRHYLSALILFVLSALASFAHAHPHNWIDLEASFILNDKGQLTEIRQTWEFDIFYSAIVYAEMMNDYLNEETGYKKLAQNMANSLNDYGYFSDLIIAKRKVDLPKAKVSILSSTMKENQRRMVLELHFKFDEPITVEGKEISWSVYDPSYYIAMTYNEPESFIVLGGNATECSKTLNEAEPEDELVDFAQSLDKDATAPNTLGREFAQTIRLNCF